jgi:hypothetical protein
MNVSCERVGSIIHEDLDMFVASFLHGRAKYLSAPMYYTYCNADNSSVMSRELFCYQIFNFMNAICIALVR